MEQSKQANIKQW